jgi:CheY-like chemotaxis protein
MPFLFLQRVVLPSSFFMPSSQHTILIAEPHPDTRELYAASLDSLELAVQTCANLTELKRAIHDWQPDVLLLSLDLPPGLSAIREIKRKHPSLSVIVLGEIPEQHQGRLLDLGASAHLNPRFLKPHDIALTVRHLLATIPYK